MAQKILETAGLKIKSAEKGTDALFFMSVAQAKALAKLAVEDPETIQDKPSKEAKAKAQQALQQSPGVDIALFGRMVADEPALNVDAWPKWPTVFLHIKSAMNMIISLLLTTFLPEDTAGAGHIGTVEFNSSTLYRYATVAVHDLHKYLGPDTAKAVTGFVQAFVCSMPTGKQNTFANRTLPDAVMVTIRKDQPINLVGAFERPVQAGKNNEEGFVMASARALVEHALKTYENWLGEPDVSLITGDLLSEAWGKATFYGSTGQTGKKKLCNG